MDTLFDLDFPAICREFPNQLVVNYYNDKGEPRRWASEVFHDKSGYGAQVHRAIQEIRGHSFNVRLVK